jgi:hypothetical protein
MLTGPKWKAAFYIDESASKEQSDLLAKIFSGQAGGFFAAATVFLLQLLILLVRVLDIKSAPIECHESLMG